jgi:hypothetical protein
MSTWADLATADPELAAFGANLVQAQVPAKLRRPDSFTGYAFIATVRKDGGPRVHPLCPVMAGGRLYVTTLPASPKLYDLQRDGRYALHAFLGAEDAEFSVRGRAKEVHDGGVQALLEAAAEGWAPIHEHIFELEIDRADSTAWANFGTPEAHAVRRRWVAGG